MSTTFGIVLDRLNELVDFILPFYLIFSIAVIAALAVVSSKKSATEPVDYTYQKKVNTVTDWRMKYAGKWNKIERQNFYEVM